MKGEIEVIGKPRAWYPTASMMCEVQEIDFRDETAIIQPIGDFLPYIGVPFADIVMCWPTGLPDKNGKEAYENDRLCYGYELTPHRVYGVIRFGEIPDMTSRSRHLGFYIEWENDGENHWNEWWRHDIGYWLEIAEIVGNIHEGGDSVAAK